MSGPGTSTAPLREEIEGAVAAIRAEPAAVAPRMALFQLACVVGDWERARTQLDTLVKLDSDYTLLARVYGRLIEAEATRARVFAGSEQPVAFGEPPTWLAMMARALQLGATAGADQARELREQARNEAAARRGKIGDDTFAWLMDADPRLGPALEVVVDGQYRWLPLELLRELRAEAPRTMRDVVWQRATLLLVNEIELGVFVPVRYPGSEAEEDDAVRLAKETRWVERDGEQWGLGQRMLATDAGDYPFLDIRRLRFIDAEQIRDG